MRPLMPFQKTQLPPPTKKKRMKQLLAKNTCIHYKELPLDLEWPGAQI